MYMNFEVYDEGLANEVKNVETIEGANLKISVLESIIYDFVREAFNEADFTLSIYNIEYIFAEVISRFKEKEIKTKALEQEPKTGHWIKVIKPLPLSDSCKECVRCSRCGTHWEYSFKFCPNCGADMNEIQDSEVTDNG